MTITCCPLSSSGDGDAAKCFEETTPVAQHDHQCCECRETIPKGSKYERAKGMWSGVWSTHKTCLSCVEIRDHFACDGWVYEQLWQDLEDHFFPDMRAGGPCLNGLSPAAKQRLFDRRTAWLLRNA